MGDGGVGGCGCRGEQRRSRVETTPRDLIAELAYMDVVFPSGSIAGEWRCPVRQGPPGYTRAMEPPAAMEPA